MCRSFNTLPHSSTGVTPHKTMFYQRDISFLEKIITFPIDSLQDPTIDIPAVKRYLKRAARHRKWKYDRIRKCFKYFVDQQVLLRVHHLTDTMGKLTNTFFSFIQRVFCCDQSSPQQHHGTVESHQRCKRGLPQRMSCQAM